MKKRRLLAFAAALAVSPVYAGGVFFNSNQSAEYFRTFERNAATDNADAVYYNMAGTVKMKEGLYANVSNQTLFQKAEVKTENYPSDKTYTSDNPVWFCPNIYVLYRKDNWSAFTGVETIGATAIREWEDGLPTLDLMSIQSSGTGESYLKGSSYYLAFRIGGAYAVNEMIAVAAAGRVVYSQQNAEGWIMTGLGKNEFDYTDEALGYSGEFSVDVFPVKGMTVSFTYETATSLEFERNINNGKDGGMFTDGEKKNLDLPQALRFGISYNFTEKFRAEFGVDAYLEKYADFERLDDSTAGIDSDDAYGNTYEEGLTFEYTFDNEFLASIGFNLTQIGQKKSATTDISAAGGHADYFSIGLGCQYSPIEDLKINIGVAHTRFQDKYSNSDAYDAMTMSPGASKEYYKEYYTVAIGAEYKFI